MRSDLDIKTSKQKDNYDHFTRMRMSIPVVSRLAAVLPLPSRKSGDNILTPQYRILTHTSNSILQFSINNQNKMSTHHHHSSLPSRPSSNSTTRLSTTAPSASSQNRQRQYAHLNAQLAQLNAHLADMENLLRMTAVQAEYVRGLGGWMGGL